MEDVLTKPQGLNAYILKIIAITGMVLQHTVIILPNHIPVVLHFPMQLAGGFTFPIMAFLLVEGYRLTSSVKRYVTRLLVFAVISHVPYVMAFGVPFFRLNIMYTLAFGVLSLVFYDRAKSKGLFWGLFIPYALLSFLFLDWPVVGPVVIVLYHIFRTESYRRIVPPLVAGGGNFVLGIVIGVVAVALVAFLAIASPDALYDLKSELDKLLYDVDANPLMGLANLLFPVGSILSLFLVRRYNGTRGPSLKFFFYAVYPLHLAILAFLRLAF